MRPLRGPRRGRYGAVATEFAGFIGRRRTGHSGMDVQLRVGRPFGGFNPIREAGAPLWTETASMPELDVPVFLTRSGIRYHRDPNCAGLAEARSPVRQVPVAEAVANDRT